MELLEQRILRDGLVGEGDVLKVGSFLNQQIDVGLLQQMGQEFRRLFDGEHIDRILTVEASGIAIAVITAQYFDVPVVFAKKSRTTNMAADVYSAEAYSYTHRRSYDIVVSREFIRPGERILIVDDFLARGSAVRALMRIVDQAGAVTAGIGIAIEKTYQGAGTELRQEGLHVESLARIAGLSVTDGIEFVR